MTNTTNYQLKVIEGTDIVNPLTTEPANMQKIDETMFENAKGMVGKATAVRSGTTFAIVRTGKAKPAVFRFTAGADFAEGNTFTVDAVSVEARTPSGNDLPARYFTANADVLCILEGSRLTVYGNFSDPLSVHPVGSIAIFANSFNPNTWGGSWTKIGENLALRQASNAHPAGTSFGEAEHRLTIDEMPSHSHSLKNAPGFGAGGSDPARMRADDNKPKNTWESFSVNPTGGNKPHNNIGPSYAVNIWIRNS